jgi:hypothetical protein
MAELSKSTDHSVMQSLAALRELEVERVQHEAAVLKAAAMEAESRRRAAVEELVTQAQAAAAAETARQQREQELELARIAQARMSQQQAFAIEAHRHAEALAAHRVAMERELARTEARTKRPRWMIASALVATVGVCAAVAFAMDRAQRADQSAAAHWAAANQLTVAKQQRKDQLAKVDALTASLGVTQSKLDAAIA